MNKPIPKFAWSTSAKTTSSASSASSAQLENSRKSETCVTPNELADRYRFIRKIGQGAQGSVFLAVRKSDDLKVAIKHLDIDSVQNWKEYDLFHREAEVLKSLSIEGVAKFYEAPEYLDISHPSAYIVQEYIDAHSLQKMMDAGCRLSINRVLKLIVKILDILNKLHTHNPPIIHRDLKPANILMKQLPDGNYQPYLIDFGAVANPQVQTGGSTVAGTYGYMPPEQLMGKPVPASDIYSLAATIVYLLSGVQPGNMQVTDFHLIIDPYMENIPNGVTATLHQMLEPKLDSRLSDYNILRERFEMLASGKFELSSNKVSALDDAKLRSVKKFGQRGNIDLWLSLGDTSSRKLPASYQNLTKHLDVDNKSIYPKIIRSEVKNFLLSLGLLYLFLIIGLFVFFISDDRSASMYLWTAMFTGIPCIMILVLGKIQYDEIKPYFNSRDAVWKPNEIYDDMHLQNINKILSKGAKIIATVTDLSYVPASSDDFEIYSMKFKNLYTMDGRLMNSIQNTDRNEINETLAYSHTYPSFKIKYKFNPPDDDNPDDLLHEIIIHSEMRDVLHVGDPLPILYYVNPNDHLDVMSMPFPYPLDDIASFGDIYYRKRKA